jgi:Ca-activated chloride channel family protein
MIRRIPFAALALLVLAPPLARGQGVLININVNEPAALPRPTVIIVPPRPPVPIPRPRPIPVLEYRIKDLTVDAKLSGQVAKVQVSQTFVNTGYAPMEVCFVFPIPYDGAIDRLTLMVDGKEHEAKLLDAKQARAIYESIVRKNQDPALLEWVGTGMFKTSVFPVPPQGQRTVTLRYTQLCRKSQGLTDFLFPLSTAKYTTKPVETLNVRLSIESEHDIKNIYSPSHAVDIKRPDDKHATISYTVQNQVPTTDFRLLYDVGAGKVGSSVLSFRRADDEGYFLLLASPEVKTPPEAPPGKTVIFVIDRSGSMAGKKIEQAKGALKFVLNNLREGDTFNIVAYDSEVESFRPEIERFNDTTRKAAIGFVEGLYAGSGTNIDGGLKTALAHLKDASRPSYVIFLTDGLPTVGEQHETKIIANAKNNNQARARIFSFGVGYDVNSRLLDGLVRANFGQADYVRPNEDIEAVVSRFYSKISSPVLTGVTIAFGLDGIKPEEGPPINRMYPKDQLDLFAGQQLVVVGRYKKHGAAKVTITGKIGGAEQKFDFPATLVEKSPDDTNAFVEKLWAVRRVGEIIDQIDLAGRNEELVKELVTLSTKHGILTPYTAFLADDTGAVPRDFAKATSEARRGLERLETVADGREGFAQRRFKGGLQLAEQAPGAALRSGRAREPAGAAGGIAADESKSASRPNQQDRAYYLDADDKEVIVESVKYVGAKTFYRRGGQWVDSIVKPEAEKAPIKVERFSPQYFELVDRHGRNLTQYLSNDEPVIVELEGKTYQF